MNAFEVCTNLGNNLNHSMHVTLCGKFILYKLLMAQFCFEFSILYREYLPGHSSENMFQHATIEGRQL
jgi:hypothetical protein